MALFASCTSRMSLCRSRISAEFPSGSGSCSTKHASSSRRTSRRVSSGEVPADKASSSVRILPVRSMSPAESMTETASIRPEPQIPAGETSPITFSSISAPLPPDAGFAPVRPESAPARPKASPLSQRLTPSMAPSVARIPWRIAAPSKAGPAAVEHTRIRPFSVTATSPFVPISTNTSRLSLFSRSSASNPAVISEPT